MWNQRKGRHYDYFHARALLTWPVLAQIYRSSRTLMGSPSVFTLRISGDAATTMDGPCRPDQSTVMTNHTMPDAYYSKHIYLALGIHCDNLVSVTLAMYLIHYNQGVTSIVVSSSGASSRQLGAEHLWRRSQRVCLQSPLWPKRVGRSEMHMLNSLQRIWSPKPWDFFTDSIPSIFCLPSLIWQEPPETLF